MTREQVSSLSPRFFNGSHEWSTASGAAWSRKIYRSQSEEVPRVRSNYHSSKGELAALHYSLFKFEHFLKQGPFTLWTDNMTVVHWETMKEPGGCVKRWLEDFSYFQFTPWHQPGKELVNADCLSRNKNLPSPVGSQKRDKL